MKNTDEHKSCSGVIFKTGSGISATIQQIIIPSLRVNEILIKVVAIGVNRADLEQAKGNYPPLPGTTEV